MAGPVPMHQPIFSAAQVAECRALLRRRSAPRDQVFRAQLALVLGETPTLDSVSAGRRLGKHANWVRYWRRIWAREGFRLTDRPGRGRKPRVSPPAGGDGGGAGLRAAAGA
jgi:hypothetical protein